MEQAKKAGLFSVTSDEIKTLLKFRPNPEGKSKLIMILLATIFGPVSVAGALVFFARGYMRFMKPKHLLPDFHKMPNIVRVGMIIGAVLAWGVLIAALFIARELAHNTFGTDTVTVFAFLGGNLALSGLVYGVFKRWQTGQHNLMINKNKHGSARCATEDEMRKDLSKEGLFVGANYAFSQPGHLLLAASTRGSKGTGLILPNILRVKGYKGNMIVVDTKGENAAVAARYLRAQGKRVIILNPFQLLVEILGETDSYNPLDLVSDKSDPHLVDNVALIAELLCPSKANDHNEFFTIGARQIVAALLLHIVTSDKFPNPTLADLWRVSRLSGNDWDNLLADMAVCTDPVNGEVVRGSANELLKQMASGETWGSLMANVLQATDVFKSGVMQNAMKTGFDPYSLTADDSNNTVVFVILPVDKLDSHSRFLRLVVTTMMRAIVRKPNPDVHTTIIADEAASIGKVQEFQTCLATYGGLGVSLWLVYQDLSQIVEQYGQHKWQSVVANCQVRIYSSIKDNFTAQYVSDAMGVTTDTYYKMGKFGFAGEAEHLQRPLFTPDEIRGVSRDNFILFVGENSFTTIPKVPYYHMPELKQNKQPVYDKNPYVKNSL